MQIAKQVYGINVADNAMIFFQRRHAKPTSQGASMLNPDSRKLGKEDFCYALPAKTKGQCRA